MAQNRQVARTLLLGLVMGGVLIAEAAAASISAQEAKHHVDEVQTVCGKVTLARFAATAEDKTTFLYLDQAEPQPVFAVTIASENRSNFSKPPEQSYLSKKICVTGRIASRSGLPHIEVKTPSEIRIDSDSASTRDCIPASRCCKVCRNSKACGNSCISRSYTCRKGRGCACNFSEVCR